MSETKDDIMEQNNAANISDENIIPVPVPVIPEPIQNSTLDNSTKSNIQNIAEVIAQESGIEANEDIQHILNNAPAQQDFEKSTLFMTVKKREYATNPEKQLDKISAANKEEPEQVETQQPIKESRPLFSFLKKTEQSQSIDENIVDNSSENTDQQQHIPPIQQMRFEAPLDSNIDPNLTASQNLTGELGVLTSDLIWNNFENGLPELMGSYVVKLSESIAEDPIISEDAQLQLKEDIARRNKENKEKFQIPEWYKDQIRKPLRAICVEKGIETSIPPTVQLLIGVGIMLALFLIPTIMEVRKSNDMYIKRLDLHFESLREIERQKLKELKKQKEGGQND